jgi:hypothetical protein
MAKIQELQEELRNLFSGRAIKLLDTLLPLVIFLLGNQFFGLSAALAASLAGAGLFTIVRLIQRENPVFALAGVGGAALAAGIAYLSGSESGFFIPGLISGGLTILICLGSVVLRRPAAAWTSHLTRRWPLEWYWLDRVRPAYAEVSLIWAGAFGARTGLEYWLLQQEAINALGAAKILLGWPYTILILILSYLYGIWRLKTLKGPSVEEFRAGITPPWQGQKRGF